MSRPGEWNSFRRWLYHEELALKKGVKGVETHLLLDGGKLAIPDERNEEFLIRYSRALFEGDWTYVVETKTAPVFYMMAEFDLKIIGRENHQR